MAMKEWTDTQENALKTLSADKQAALDAVNTAVSTLVAYAPSTLDHSFDTVIEGFIKNNAQEIFDMLNAHYVASPS